MSAQWLPHTDNMTVYSYGINSCCNQGNGWWWWVRVMCSYNVIQDVLYFPLYVPWSQELI